MWKGVFAIISWSSPVEPRAANAPGA